MTCLHGFVHEIENLDSEFCPACIRLTWYRRIVEINTLYKSVRDKETRKTSHPCLVYL